MISFHRLRRKGIELYILVTSHDDIGFEQLGGVSHPKDDTLKFS